MHSDAGQLRYTYKKKCISVFTFRGNMHERVNEWTVARATATKNFPYW